MQWFSSFKQYPFLNPKFHMQFVQQRLAQSSWTCAVLAKIKILLNNHSNPRYFLIKFRLLGFKLSKTLLRSSGKIFVNLTHRYQDEDLRGQNLCEISVLKMRWTFSYQCQLMKILLLIMLLSRWFLFHQ